MEHLNETVSKWLFKQRLILVIILKQMKQFNKAPA